MAKPRGRKLKVYRTPIGFHDAYVAAPSQKAALEAWGSGTNLFASGAAEVVTDPELAAAALAHPGEVLKVLRGTTAEQLAALADSVGPGKASSKGSAKKKTPSAKAIRLKPLPRPKRTRLTEAEEGLQALETRQEKDLEQLEEQRRETERRIKDAKNRQEEELKAAQAKVDAERSDYEAAIGQWERKRKVES
jgi:hypothetical protein